MTKNKNEFTVVRCAKVELFGMRDSPNAQRWKTLSVDIQRMINRLWQIWLCHHSNKGTAELMRNFLDANKRWKETGEGEKPVAPAKPLEEPLTKSADPRSFYRIISKEFPNVNLRTAGLVTNAWQSELGSRKASSGSLSGWLAILFGLESMPSYTRPQPIPFDKDNSKLFRDGDKLKLSIRIERDPETGKSIVDECVLMLNKRKAASMRKIVERIIEGEYAWKGSDLFFDRRSGKWFASLAYAMPKAERIAADPNKVIIVRPGKNTPWRVAISDNGKLSSSWRFGGSGTNIVYGRMSIQRERRQRAEHYRYSGSNRKGHGRRHADAVWTKLSSRWRNFVKRYNSEIGKQLINLARSRGCGAIIYCQPKDQQRDDRFLSSAGKDERSKMTWDYFQFATLLAGKCEDHGIAFTNAANRMRSVRKLDAPKRKKRA